jgi:hypothetical protein
MTRSHASLLLPALLVLTLASPTLAEQKGGGPDGVTVGDLVNHGFICKPFGDGMLHCTNPDNGIPSWVCYPNEICTPGKPRSLGGGRFRDLAPSSATTVMVR